ncbi:MAG: nitrite reductase small subunit NirD [Dermatophilaceae bacterium]
MSTQAAVHDAPPPAVVGTPVCRLGDLEPERGVAALVDSVQVALFLLHDGTLAAVDHHDPYSGANVLARGIVGDRAGTPTVASPIHKQVFDLHSGRSLDDPTVLIRVHDTWVEDGVVHVAVRR